MENSLTPGIGFAVLGGSIYLVAPLFGMSTMGSLMALASASAAIGLVLVARALLRSAGRSQGAWFAIGAAFVLVPRAVSLASEWLHVTAFDGSWIRHALLALGAVGPILMLAPIGMAAPQTRSTTAAPDS